MDLAPEQMGEVFRHVPFDLANQVAGNMPRLAIVTLTDLEKKRSREIESTLVSCNPVFVVLPRRSESKEETYRMYLPATINQQP